MNDVIRRVAAVISQHRPDDSGRCSCSKWSVEAVFWPEWSEHLAGVLLDPWQSGGAVVAPVGRSGAET